MKITKSAAVSIAAIFVAGCSAIPGWTTGTTAPGAQAIAAGNSQVAAVQALGAKVRNQIAVASGRGISSDLALQYQSRGDEALREGKLAYAAEQYGRAEEAVTMTEARTEGTQPERHLAKNANTETYKAHGLHTSRAHTGRLARKVKTDINRAKDRGYDVNEAERHKKLGDSHMKSGQFADADNEYGAAERALRQAQARKTSTTGGAATAATGGTSELTVASPSTPSGHPTRQQAEAMKARVEREIQRAKDKGSDVSKAELKHQEGDQALAVSNFAEAERAYSDARAALPRTAGESSAESK